MKDYAKIAKDVRMQEKLAEKQTIQAFVQEALPEICSEAIQEAERTAQAGEIYFPLDVNNFTDGLNGVLQIKVKHQNEKSPAKFARPKKGCNKSDRRESTSPAEVKFGC